MASAQASSRSSSQVSDPWSALVRRSLDAWREPARSQMPIAEQFLRKFTNLDDFLSQCGTYKSPMFWMFQCREAFLSQKTMSCWSRDRLDDYVILPALNGFVLSDQCFFVSHFWQTKGHPDPSGSFLRRFQSSLHPQDWLYIWIDWTCVPQHPRSASEERYFMHGLRTMPGIIRNCAFAWFYPPFEARLWILYEVAEFVLSCESIGGVDPIAYIQNFQDMREFSAHIKEMLRDGVRTTLKRHGYKCIYERDEEFLTSWIEVLVLLKRLRVNIATVRQLLDSLTWFPSTQDYMLHTTEGFLSLQRFEGKLTLRGECHTFTPFPQWDDGKFTSNIGSSSE